MNHVVPWFSRSTGDLTGLLLVNVTPSVLSSSFEYLLGDRFSGHSEERRTFSFELFLKEEVPVQLRTVSFQGSSPEVLSEPLEHFWSLLQDL